MKKQLFILTSTLLFCSIINFTHSQTYTSIATDAPTDLGASGTLPEGTDLSYYYDATGDSLWFRVTIGTNFNATTFGMNIFIDTDNSQSTGNAWWGSAPQNPTFKYEKFLTAWVTGGPNFTGTIGIGDYAGTQLSTPNYTNLAQNNLVIKANSTSKTYTLGVKRSDIGNITIMNVIAVVGTNQYWNDAIPNSGYGTINLATGIDDNKNKLNIVTYPVPANDKLVIKGWANGNPVHIEIFDMVGKSVYVHNADTKNENYAEIDISALSKGAYTIQVRQNDSVHTNKIIIAGN